MGWRLVIQDRKFKMVNGWVVGKSISPPPSTLHKFLFNWKDYLGYLNPRFYPFMSLIIIILPKQTLFSTSHTFVIVTSEHVSDQFPTYNNYFRYLQCVAEIGMSVLVYHLVANIPA